MGPASPARYALVFANPGTVEPKPGKTKTGVWMIVEVKVPQLSESVAEATLLEWHKKAGDPVARDENLIEIETDKVVMELPSPADGVLVEIVKAERSAVTSGEVIARIDTDVKARQAVDNSGFQI